MGVREDRCPATDSFGQRTPLPGYRQLRPTYRAARRVMHHKSRRPRDRLAAVRWCGPAAALTATTVFRRSRWEHGGERRRRTSRRRRGTRGASPCPQDAQGIGEDGGWCLPDMLAPGGQSAGQLQSGLADAPARPP